MKLTATLTRNIVLLLLTGTIILKSNNLFAQWYPVGPPDIGFGGKNSSNINSIIGDNSGNLYAAGYFSSSDLHNSYVAHWNGTSWNELGNIKSLGMSEILISTICKDPSDNIYAAGYIYNSNYELTVVKWNGTSWSEIPSLSNLTVAEIKNICSDPAGNIYVGGVLINSNGHTVVAKWDGTTWSELGASTGGLGASGTINSICSDALGNIYAVGDFYNSNGNAYVAKWNGTSWSELIGLNNGNQVYNLSKVCADKTGNIYTTGNYFNINGEKYIEKWDGTGWSKIYTNYNPVLTISCDSFNNLYAAFNSGVIAKWNGFAWSNLAGSAEVFSPTKCIYIDQAANVYCGGNFTNKKGQAYVAKLNSKSWSELGASSILAINKNALSICTDAGGNMYAAGNFFNKDLSGNPYYYVGKWNGSTWLELPGLDTLESQENYGGPGSASKIYSIHCDAAGNIYAGCNSSSYSDYYVAKWNGSQWTRLGNPYDFSPSGIITGICSDAAGNIYAAGDFLNSNDNYYVAKWDGTSWTELGGLDALAANGKINSITCDAAGIIYAAGEFTNSNWNYYVAKWDGTSWSELGGVDALAANYYINTICTDKMGKIYAAGSFSNSSGNYYVAQWDGTSWSELGGVDALAANSDINVITTDTAGNIYATGSFYNSMDKYFIAKWDGTIWSPFLNNEFDNEVVGIHIDKSNRVFSTITTPASPYGKYWLSYYKDCPNTSTSDTTASVCNGLVWHNVPYSQSGDYVWHTTNRWGCDSAVTLHLTVKSVKSSTTVVHAGCFGSSTGSITVTANSGTGPYSFRLGTVGTTYSNGTNTYTFNNLRSGQYRVFVNDASVGCSSYSPQIYIDQSPALSATIAVTDVKCNGQADGSIVALPLNGNAPITFKLGLAGVYGPSNTFNGLRAATYSLYLKDAVGCSNFIKVTVQQPTPLQLDLSITNISCPGGQDGAINATGMGGIEPYLYRFGSTGTLSTSSSFTSLKKGSYSVSIEDDNGCKLTKTAIVSQPPALQQTFTIKDVDCAGGQNGAITSNAVGGTAPYMYQFGSTGAYAALNNFTGLRKGSYRIYIKDANNCLFNSAAIVKEPTKVGVTFSKTDVTCTNANNGTITLSGNGGISPYKFRLGTTGNFVNNNFYNNLRPGNYTGYVQDNNGCLSGVATIPILQSPNPCFTVSSMSPERILDVQNEGQFTAVLSPNPTTNLFNLTVKGNNKENVQVRIADVSGKLMYTKNMMANQTLQIGEMLSPGVYFIEVRQNDKVKILKGVKMR